MILAVQSSVISRLRSQNEELHAAALESQQTSPTPPADELRKLRADNDEVRKLRAEISQLQEQLKELAALRAENQRLLAEVAALNAAAPPQQDFVGQAAEKAESMKCVQNLKLMALAARFWAGDHNEAFPENFSEVFTEDVRKSLESYGDFPTPSSLRKLGFCPAGGGVLPYRIVSPGSSATDPDVVYALCPSHGFVSLMDGSVRLRYPGLTVRPDGKTVIATPSPKAP